MASYFLQTGYGKLKSVFAVGGLISGLGIVGGGAYLIFTSSLVVGALMITGGGIEVINAIFNFVDIKSWQEMKKAIDELEKVRVKFEETLKEYSAERVKFGEVREQFSKENTNLKENVDHLKENVDIVATTSQKLEEENAKLKDTAAQYVAQLATITKLAQDRDEEVKNLTELKRKMERSNEEYSKNNEELKVNLSTTVAINETLSIELATHKEIRKRLEEHLVQIETLSKQYEEQNIALQATVEKHKTQLQEADKMIESLKKQLVQFHQLYESMKQYVTLLQQAGELNMEYHKTIGDDIDKLTSTSGEIQHNTSLLTTIIDKLQDSVNAKTKADFIKADKNKDGKIDEEEFIDAFGVDDNTDDIV